MASFQRLRALFFLALVWLCAWAISPALAQTPSMPTNILIFDDVSPGIGAIVDGGVTNDTMPRFSGLADSGSTVLISSNGSPIGNATALADGIWMFTPAAPLAYGTYNFTFSASNGNGTSLTSTPYVITVVQQPPPPTLTKVLDDVGRIQGVVANGGATDDTRPSLFGDAAPNNALTAQIYANGILIGSTPVNANGTWSFTPSSNLSDGTQSFTVTVTNSGDTSLPSTPYVVTVDTIPPLPPVLTNVTTSGSGGSSQLTFTGTAEANTLVKMYLDGVSVDVVSVNANGQWTLTVGPLSISGTQAFQATAEDLAGNVSAPSPPFVPLSNDLVAMLSGGGQAQVAINSDTAGCTVNTPPAFVQANLSGAPANATAPLGALTFDVTGCPGATLTVRITYPSGRLATLTPYKFGPASAGAASTWFAHGNVVGDSVIYTVTDNGVGDSNPAPGVIADPFAPMLLAAPGPATVQHVPTLGQWALMLLTVLLAGLGLHAQRRKALV